MKCYKFFGCKELECPMHQEEGDGNNCWEVKPARTLCINKQAEPSSLEEKQVYCKFCLFYEYMNKSK